MATKAYMDATAQGHSIQSTVCFSFINSGMSPPPSPMAKLSTTSPQRRHRVTTVSCKTILTMSMTCDVRGVKVTNFVHHTPR